jgi:spore maturation protein CgeB
MRFLIINTDYPQFLSSLYGQHPGLESEAYEEQLQLRNESLFGVADFYSSNLRELGQAAWDVHANNEFMQQQWAQEQGLRVSPARQWQFRLRKGVVPWWFRVTNQKWFYEILAAQIRYYEPDVLLNQDIGAISTDFLRELKPRVRLLVGQHAATQLPEEDFSSYDLIISSFPPTVDLFRRKGMPAELNRMGFEPKVLPSLKTESRRFEATFIGSFISVHGSRTKLLETLCSRIEQVRVWGPDIDSVSPDSPLRSCYGGQAWGRDMYQILSNSKIAINHHGDIAPYANNMRLYEATGVGTLLITDYKDNLSTLFEPGKEVVAYHSAEECAELVSYYLTHEGERADIARAGQTRTLREHTYLHRMQELLDILGRYL